MNDDAKIPPRLQAILDRLEDLGYATDRDIAGAVLAAYKLGQHAAWDGRLRPEQAEKLEAWREQQDATVAARQGKDREAYYGAIGGAYTYSMTPTSLGTAVTVTNGVTGDSINLTDYGDW